MSPGPRTATATTLTPCELLRVNNSQFDSLLEASPAIREVLQEAMEARLGRMDAEAQGRRPHRAGLSMLMRVTTVSRPVRGRR